MNTDYEPDEYLTCGHAATHWLDKIASRKLCAACRDATFGAQQ